MNWLGVLAIALLTAGLVGQGFEMRKIRKSSMTDKTSYSKIFLNKRTIPWHVLIGIGLVLWYMSEKIYQV